MDPYFKLMGEALAHQNDPDSVGASPLATGLSSDDGAASVSTLRASIPSACNCHAIPGEQHLIGCPLRVQPFRLRCPKCLDSMAVDRDEHDPADATVMEIICPHCDDGDRHSPRYFRCDGSELLFGRDFGLPHAPGEAQ